MEQAFKEEIDRINAAPGVFFTPAKKKGYICPICNNGSGEDGTGLAYNKRTGKYKCFKCNAYGDVVDFIALAYGITPGTREAFQKAKEIYRMDEQTITPTPRKTEPAAPEKKSPSLTQEEVKAYLKRCISSADQPMISSLKAYLSSRGISEATGRRLLFGYDEQKQQVVIPGFRYPAEGEEKPQAWYACRPTDRKAYYNAPGVPIGIFNLYAIDTACADGKPLFVTEGAFDAASIEEVGGCALGINSTSNVGLFIEQLQLAESKPVKVYAALDHDEAGQKANEELIAAVTALGVECVSFDFGSQKDANEALTADRDELKRRVRLAQATKEEREAAEDLEQSKASALLPDFLKRVRNGETSEPISTGFKKLDEVIGGGLFPKLYVIGATPGLGKTTLCLQIADNVAREGMGVLFFSQEMSREELIAKSISRISCEQSDTKRGLRENDILVSGHLTGDKLEAFEKAAVTYTKENSGKIHFYEGRITAGNIKKKVERYISYYGKAPLVIVDYLQILLPESEARSEREQIDISVDILTKIRRELKAPIIVISSFGRDSYLTPASNTSFKGSGGIEFSADCTITMELTTIRGKAASETGRPDKVKAAITEAVTSAMRQARRDITLTFHKNRGAKTGDFLQLCYFPAVNYFTEDITIATLEKT